MKKVPVGVDDFEQLISQDYYFVDKSLLIKELLDKHLPATLIPRPRRFGKTINMSMLRYFFEINEKSKKHLFKDLKISKYPDCMQHQGQYPVIFMSLKETKSDDWETCLNHIKEVICKEFHRHAYLSTSPSLNDTQKKEFLSIMNKEAALIDYQLALKHLCEYLSLHHQKKTIVLIDEYDTPVHAGFINNYYDNIISFTRTFLGAGLKGNNDLNFGILTGILRIAKESVFSGLNNLAVYGILSNNCADKFGFLENEVIELLKTFDLSSEINNVKTWYNGYAIGKESSIYNPWSVLNFINEGAEYQPYWVNSSDNLLIKELFLKGSSLIKKDIELLLNGKNVEQRINDNITFPSLYLRDDIIWSFLLSCGYLTFSEIYNKDTILFGSLKLPNNEVHAFYKLIVISLLEENLGIEEYQAMLHSLVSGKIEEFKSIFYEIVLSSLSSFDVGGKTPEKFYHAFVAGMLVSLKENYEVTSNRESGYGRYDVMIIPRKPTPKNYGIIIEFKKKRDTDPTLEHAAQKGLEQIEERAYEIQLRNRGITNIIKLAIAFDKKKALILEG